MLRGKKAHLSALLLSLFSLLCILAVTACGGATSSAKKNVPLIVDTGPTGDFTLNFNPFSSGALIVTYGLIYEPLLYTNMITGKIQPWLASSYSMAPDARSVTFTLNPAAKWSDGQPLTADDVVFTFDLIHRYPALDTNGVWAYIQSVSATSARTVVFTFTSPNSSLMYYIATKVYIAPKHIWSSISDPVKATNPNPVGSGPYLLKSFSSQNITVVKNPHYWQPGEPSINEVQFPASNDNSGIELKLYSNRTDWAGIPAHNVQQLYVDRDPAHHHYWFEPVDSNILVVNTTEYPLNQVAVRQAISEALDRSKMSKVAEQGYEPVANPTGIIPSQQQQYLNPAYRNLSFQYNTAQAMSTLEDAGFKKGSDGFFVDKNGKKLSLKIDVVSAYSDWLSLVQIAAQNLQAAGIDATVNGIGVGDWASRLSNGQFDLSMDSMPQGPSPYYAYNGMLNSANSAPIGQPAAGDPGRWNDATTNALLKQYTTSINPAVQKQAIDGLQKIVVEQLPVIPLLFDVAWAEYNSSNFVGWPTPSNPYAPPANFYTPDLAYILLHLKPAS